MNYVSLDLEWNSTKNETTDKFVNEIIEIGAVLLDENFNEISSFHEIIKPKLSTKLNRYVKKLTNISEEEIEKGKAFEDVIKDFSKWIPNDNIIITWSNTDLHVLMDNYKTFLNRSKIDFISAYVDLQKYVARFVKSTPGQQISLSDAAAQLNFDTSNFYLHRALDDSRICAALLKLTFDPKIFCGYISNAKKKDFYKRLCFKPYYISELDSPFIDKAALRLKCNNCGKQTRRITPIKQRQKAFYADYFCPKCRDEYKLRVRFKKTFDNILISRTIKKVEQKAEEKAIGQTV